MGLALSGSEIKPQRKIADFLPVVKSDENQIRQVTHNLVLNAREAMPHGGSLFIEADKTLGPEDAPDLPKGFYLHLLFRDEGWGIRPEYLTRVFDPYFTTKEMGITKGMGFGLSICYSIVKRHSGHIRLESKRGSGTTVTIYLPVAREPANQG